MCLTACLIASSFLMVGKSPLMGCLLKLGFRSTNFLDIVAIRAPGILYISRIFQPFLTRTKTLCQLLATSTPSVTQDPESYHGRVDISITPEMQGDYLRCSLPLPRDPITLIMTRYTGYISLLIGSRKLKRQSWTGRSNPLTLPVCSKIFPAAG